MSYSNQQQPYSRPTSATPTSGSNLSRTNSIDVAAQLFQHCDSDRNGILNMNELQTALRNTDNSYYDIITVKSLMSTLFDRNKAEVNLDEFRRLVEFLKQWKSHFSRCDVDRSGKLDISEFEQAIISFGYQVSNKFVQNVFYDLAEQENGQFYIQFDRFVQGCLFVKKVHESFSRLDVGRTRIIQLDFDAYAAECLDFHRS